MLMSVEQGVEPSAANAPRTSPRAGDVLGRFRLEERLGEGGVGVVYRARDGADGQDVALKLLKHELSRDQAFVRRFVREAQVARTVQHRHLVPVVDAGETDGIHYLAARFYPRGSLDDHL